MRKAMASSTNSLSTIGLSWSERRTAAAKAQSRNADCRLAMAENAAPSRLPGMAINVGRQVAVAFMAVLGDMACVIV